MAIKNIIIGLILVLAPSARGADSELVVADRIGLPEAGIEFDWNDDATASAPREPGLSDTRWRRELERRTRKGESDLEMPRWLIELGWLAAVRGDRDASEGHYRRADDLVGDNDVLKRRLAWSRGGACAALGDFGCALRHWYEAGSTAPGNATWIPANYAYALWALDRKEQAVAWYSAAVRSNVELGRGTAATRTGRGTKLGQVSRDLFQAWSAVYAPLRSTVIADVDIDPEVRLSRIVFGESKLDPELLDRVRLAALGWRFDPVRDEGRPATLSTHLYIDVRGRPVNGGHEFEIQYAGMQARRRSGSAFRYPLAALSRSQEGTVVLSVDVGSDGRVVRTDVQESSTSQILDHATRQWVDGWTFEVDRINGKPQPMTLLVPVVYRLTGESLSYSTLPEAGKRKLRTPVSLWHR